MRTWIHLFILLVLLSSGLYAQGAGNALDFAGDDYVDCNSNFMPSDNLTIEMWVRADNDISFGGGTGILISDGDETTTGVNLTTVTISTDPYVFAPKVYINTSSGVVELTGSNFSPLVWTHVSFVFTSTSLKIYVNGSNVVSTTFGASTITNTSNNIIIGGKPGSTDRRFKGDIDEVRIWNDELSQSDINTWKSIPVTGSHPNYTSMLAYYKFDEDKIDDTSGTCVDSKASNDATNNGATWFLNSDLALPVEMALFEALPGNDGKSVELRWVTESETDNLGFNILRRSGNEQDWQKIDGYLTSPGLEGQGTVSHSSEYSYTDNNVEIDKAYQYIIANVDINGNIEYSQIADITLSKVASEYHLFPAFPNPFNPETVITFNIPVEGQVAIQIFDMNGRLVRTLNNSSLSAGTHRLTWNGRNNSGTVMASGVYIIKMESSQFTQTRKVTLVR